CVPSIPSGRFACGPRATGSLHPVPGSPSAVPTKMLSAYAGSGQRFQIECGVLLIDPSAAGPPVWRPASVATAIWDALATRDVPDLQGPNRGGAYSDERPRSRPQGPLGGTGRPPGFLKRNRLLPEAKRPYGTPLGERAGTSRSPP